LPPPKAIVIIEKNGGGEAMVWKQGTGDAYTLLAALLVEQKGVEPLPRMERQAGGKPYFPDFPRLHFNVSHSGGLCLCALDDVPVGCDIELVRPRRERLPAYALSEKELQWFRERGERWADFYTLWTLKEARVKCTGEGLRRPARDIAVPLLAPGEEGTLEGFTFTALAGTDWRGAVCRAENS